jgi:hypothetical protein
MSLCSQVKVNASSTFLMKIQFISVFIAANFCSILLLILKDFQDKVLLGNSPDPHTLLFQFMLDEFDVNFGRRLPSHEADRRCNTGTLIRTRTK